MTETGVYSWGSAAHGGGLGYIVSHSVNEVLVPRRVSLSASPKLKISQIVTGKTFSIILAVDGEVFVWGIGFGLLPSKVDIGFKVSLLAACQVSGECLLVEQDTHMLYHWEAGLNSPIPVLRQARIVKASSVAVAGPSHWLVVEKSTNSFLEISKSKRLTPGSTELVARSCRVHAYSLSGFCCAEDSLTGEVRVWSVKEGIPRKVLVRRTNEDLSNQEWESAANEFFLKNVKVICPGYAVVGEELIQFNTVPAKPDSLVLTGRVVKGVKASSVALDRTGVFILTPACDLFRVPFEEISEGVCDLGNFQPVLSQVETIESSPHHTVAVVKIFPHRDPSDLTRSEIMSLQRACALSVMRSQVTVESIADLLESLLCRPVVDYPHLVDMSFSFFRMNRSLVRCVSYGAFDRLEKSLQFRETQNEYEENPSRRFSEILVNVRASNGYVWVEDDIMRFETSSVEVVGTTRCKPTTVSPKPRPVTQEPIMHAPVSPLKTPVITMHVFEEETSEVPALDLGEFVPLADATNCAARANPHSGFQNRKVRKWTRKSLENSHPQAPWFTPEHIHPSSPPLESVIASEVRGVGRRSSRWFTNEPLAQASLAQLMVQEREEREVEEAIRLVEQYEMACALSQQASDKSKSKSNMYTNKRHRHSRSQRKQT